MLRCHGVVKPMTGLPAGRYSNTLLEQNTFLMITASLTCNIFNRFGVNAEFASLSHTKDHQENNII